MISRNAFIAALFGADGRDRVFSVVSAHDAWATVVHRTAEQYAARMNNK